VGGILAWVASILTRGDDSRSIAIYIVVGIIGALSFGLLASRESLMVGLTASTLLAGIAGSAVLLAGLTFARYRLVR